MDKGTLRVLYAHAVKLADEAGMKAASECEPQMISIKGADTDINKHYEPFPICGFAWVNFKPATTRFAHWLKKMDLASKAYEGGLNLWVSKFGQSYDKKMAYARAYADVIQTEIVLSGIEPSLSVYGAGRLD